MVKSFRVLVVALVATLVLTTAGAGHAANASKRHPAGETKRKLALGASMFPDKDLASVDSFSSLVGRAPATWTIWSSWGGADRAFPNTTFLNGLRTRAIVPLIFWMPAGGPDDGATFTYKRIKAGDHDAYLTQWAQAAKAWGGTMIVRFAQEMDGKWFPWGVDRYDNSPKRFVKAWKHIWTIFHTVGATNVRFLWSPFGACECQPELYPGDSYVDYVGFTALNWGTAIKPPWRTMSWVIRKRMERLGSLARKPVIVAEMATSRTGGNEAKWIKKGYPDVYARFPQIKAIVYFNVDMSSAGQPNWRLQAAPKALAAYRALLTQRQFQGRIK